MPRYYCDYCDIYLTHDSSSVRTSHNTGWKHRMHIENYYAGLPQDKVQEVIQSITSAYDVRTMMPRPPPTFRPGMMPGFPPPHLLQRPGMPPPMMPFGAPPRPGMMPPRPPPGFRPGMLPPAMPFGAMPMRPPMGLPPPFMMPHLPFLPGIPPPMLADGAAFKRPMDQGHQNDPAKRYRSN